MILESLIAVIIIIESGGNNNAINIKEDACGCLQIRPILVKEVNRILKKQNSKKLFTLDDRWSRMQSFRMARVFLNHQRYRYFLKHGKNPSDLDLALSWQSGGIFNKPSESYRKKLIEAGVK